MAHHAPDHPRRSAPALTRSPVYIENAIYRQWRTERWLMEVLLWPAKAPRPHRIDKLTWIAGGQDHLALALAALEQDGLIQSDGANVSATKAAISLWRLELGQEEPL